jgi:hypothetical protein
MVATTEAGTWVVPSGYALWMPANMVHDVAMHGAVAMRTAYVDVSGRPALSGTCRVISVSPLLEAALVALSTESHLYDRMGRGGHLAALVLDEIARAPATAFALPVSAVSTRGTGRGYSGREDFWFIVAVRSEDEAEIRAGEATG